MFEFGRKKSDLEKQIAKDGIEYATDRVSDLVADKIPNANIAYRFILEELDGASRGNQESRNWAEDSGINPSEYRGALSDSIPEVDGPGGPQQLLVTFGLELSGNPPLMTEFRRTVADKIMKRYCFGKYSESVEPIPASGSVFPQTEDKIDEIVDHVDQWTSPYLENFGLGFDKNLIRLYARMFTVDEENFPKDPAIVALEIIDFLVKDELKGERYDSACLMSVSVFLGGHAYLQTHGLQGEEAPTVERLSANAISRLVANQQFVDNSGVRAVVGGLLETAQIG